MTQSRIDRLRELLTARELDSLVVSDLTNVHYLSGFRGTNGVCVLGQQTQLFVTDFRYIEQAQSQIEGLDVIQGRQDLLADVADHLGGRVGFDDVHMSVRQHQRLAQLVRSGTELVAAGGLVEQLRAVKDARELAAIRRAADLTDACLFSLAERGVVGRTEREVAHELEQSARTLGAEGPSFACIVAAAEHGALPHATPRDEPIAQNTLVIVDFGCVVDGYCSDATRTFATGALDDEAAAVYELVLDAQTQALGSVRAGADVRAVDAAARERIDTAGYGERFGHGVGHGVGLEVHEAPRLAPTSEGELDAGNVVTVEPGVYMPGRFGVRIEDLVTVTDGGYEVLSRFPKTLTELSG